jgi:hypothetical protein
MLVVAGSFLGCEDPLLLPDDETTQEDDETTQGHSYSLTNVSSADIEFTAPGGEGVHHIVLTINTDTTISTFELTLDDGPAATEDLYDTTIIIMDETTGAPWNTDGLLNEGKYISLYDIPGINPGDTMYVLDIVEKPYGLSKGAVANDELWTLSLSGFTTSTNILDVSVSSHSDTANLGGLLTWGPPGIPYLSPVDPLIQAHVFLNIP